MPVAAVSRRDHIGWAQRPARTDGRSFLTSREMHEPRDLAGAVQVGHSLLEPSDEQHAALHLHEVGAREGGRSRLVGVHEREVY
jgi:hypothetical protein